MGNPLRNSDGDMKKYVEMGAPPHLFTYSLGTHGTIGSAYRRCDHYVAGG